MGCLLTQKGEGGKAEGVFKVTGTTKTEDNKIRIRFPSQTDIVYRLMVADKVEGPYVEQTRITASQDKPVEEIEIPAEFGNRFFRLEAILD